jgi:pseudaminic acid biosynthesis-associated methylase
MDMNQEQLWGSQFGAEYTERNIYSPSELNASYKNEFGISRTDLNKEFLSDLNIADMLEVGCNVCNQLRVLQEMGYEGLYGIELQRYAVERGKSLTQNVNVIQGSAFDIPYKDNYFDVVFTSGVLIHISPNDLTKVIREMYRLSKKYIWGFEYYADQYTEVKYHGHDDALWKGDFAQKFIDEFPDLKLIKYKKIPNLLIEGAMDSMYLLEKTK